MEPKTSHSSGLNKQILNNFIVKTRPSVRRGKVHVVNRIIRRARQLRQQKTGNEKEKEKLARKADKLVEELVILRKFHEDDLTKFALMNKKSLIEATNDVNSSTEERALCRLANWKTVTPEITKFREEYPDWEDKVPQLLKSIGLQYRHKRLKRLEKKGRKEQFLEKEHHNINILQKLTHIDVDPRLLAKAQDLMNTSKKNYDIGNDKFDRKDQDTFEQQEMENQDLDAERNISESDRDAFSLKVHKKTGKKLSKKKRVIENQDKDLVEEHSDDKVTSALEKSYRKGVSKKEYKKGDQEEDSQESASGDESFAGKSSSKMRQENLVKRVSGSPQELEDQDDDAGDEGISDDESDEDKASSDVWESGRNRILHEDRRDELHDDSDGESISDVESDAAECSLDMQEKHSNYTLKKQKKMDEQYEEDEDSEEGLLSDSESGIDEGFLEKAKDGQENIRENQGKSNKIVLQKKKEKLKKNIVLKDHQNDLKKKEKRKEDVTSDSEEDVMSDSEEDVLSNSEEDVMSDSDEDDMYDSEGSVIDENGGTTEITSIWEHWKEDKDTKDKKVSQSGTVNKFPKGNKLIRSKGTVKIMQLDLTDQSCVNVSLKGDDEVASDSEEEDFFVQEPKIKKRKRPKENTSDQDGAVSDSDGSHEAEDDVEHSDNEITNRGRYLDKNFKRIWGRGVDEQFQVTRGRRGTLPRGGGRGRDFDDRGGRGRDFDGGWGGRGRDYDGGRGRGYRSQPIGNSNLISIGADSTNVSPGKGYVNPNMIPVSSDWRSKLSTDKSKYSNLNMTSVTSDWKNKAASAAEVGEQPNDKWKRGNFNKQHQNPTDLDTGRSNWNNRFSSGRNDQGESLKPGWKRGRFEKRDPENPNLAPVSGNWRGNAAPAANDNTQNSLLHPSWLAKQKERKMASSINDFQGKVKKFDWDD